MSPVRTGVSGVDVPRLSRLHAEEEEPLLTDSQQSGHTYESTAAASLTTGASAGRLESSRIVMGLSPKLTPSEQGAQVGYYWEQLPEPRPSLSLEIVLENQKDTVFFNLGPHPPRLWPEDLDLVHRLWLELSAKGPGSKLHHRDIVGVALRRMNAELHSDLSREVVDDVLREISDGNHHEPPA